MNMFCRDDSGNYQPAEPTKIIATAQQILSNRLQRDENITATSPQAVEQFLQLKLAGKTREVFGVMFLNTRHQLICFRELFYGTIDGASVHPRIVVQEALACNAAACILSHNHPSGVSEPSGADLAITRRLKEALKLIDVRVLDHLVVAADNCTSLAQRGEI